jgi:hypothetical protein
MPFSNLLDSAVIALLTEQANKIANKAKSNASWSRRIPNAISVDPAKKIGKGRYEAIIRVDASGDRETGAPHAIAFEYGSGEHGEEGGKYVITPDKAEYLAFDWQPEFVPWGSRKFFGAILEDPGNSTAGRYFFNLVEHPGVEARPYMKPAVDSEIESFVFKAADVLLKALVGSTTKVIVIDGRKALPR